MNLVSDFKNSGIDILNINNSFFKDICHPYSDSNNDVVLEDRIKYIYQNYSACDDDGCVYNNIDIGNKTISCDCKVKNEININESSLNLEQLDKINIDSNFGIIKCFNLVFSFDGKLTNIGFWIFLILVITHIPFLFCYFNNGIKNICQYIINEMKKYGYIKKPTNNKEINNNSDLLNPPKKKKGNNHNL